jgi:hypothetical protein
MQNQLNINNESDNNEILSELNNAKYLGEVCKLLPTLLIKTQFGIGKYSFDKIAYKDNELVLLFNLSKENKAVIHDKIAHYLGNQFIVSANQYLYAYRWYAIS